MFWLCLLCPVSSLTLWRSKPSSLPEVPWSPQGRAAQSQNRQWELEKRRVERQWLPGVSVGSTPHPTCISAACHAACSPSCPSCWNSTSFFRLAVRNGVFPAIVVTRMSQSALQCECVSPKDTQEREEYLPSASHQITATSPGEPQGSSGCKNTRYCPQITEIHTKGMISVSPDSRIFPYTEKH